MHRLHGLPGRWHRLRSREHRRRKRSRSCFPTLTAADIVRLQSILRSLCLFPKTPVNLSICLGLDLPLSQLVLLVSSAVSSAVTGVTGFTSQLAAALYVSSSDPDHDSDR